MTNRLAPAPVASRGRRHRRVWLFAGTGLTVVALAFGTVASGSSILAWAPTATTGTTPPPPAVTTATEHQSYSRPAGRVDIDLPAGDVSLTAGDPGRVAVERRLTWSVTKPAIDESWVAGDTLQARVACPSSPDGDQCSVDYGMRLPPTAGGEVRVTAGNIDVRGIHGELRLSTTGDVTVADITAPLSVDATAGNITGSGLRSPTADVTIDAGNVSLRFAAPPDYVRVDASAGSVTIEVPRGEAYRVQLDTTVGVQQVEVAQDPAADRVIEVRTTVGEVRIRYAS